MKRTILVLLLLLLAACSAPGSGAQTGTGLERFVDEEYGVVCYQRYVGSDAIACVSYR